MTKQQFTKYLKELMKLKKAEDELNISFKKISPDFGYICFTRHEELIVDLLKEAMEDTEDWIGYFLYEMDMKFTKKKVAEDENGKNIPLRNFDDLYNVIINKK